MSERIDYAFSITDTLPVVRAAIAEATPTSTDEEILKAVMKLVRGLANPIKVAEQIVRERGGDGTIVAPPASPYNFVGERAHPLTPTRNADGSVTWEPVS